jgi:hypothetical protein
VISDELREYALTPDRFAPIPEGSSVTRFDDGRICVIQGTVWAGVSAMNFDEDELDAVIELVHELIPPEKPQTWWVGPEVRPANLVDLLTARGFAPTANGPELRAMVLTTAPPALTEEIDVRRIETYEDYVASREVQWEAFDVPQDRRESQQASMETEFAEAMEHGVPVGFLALLEGRPAATGLAIPSERGVFLVAGSTAPWARGRGLYRALVRARWDYAQARGTPALVTEAMLDTSYPILKKLGFQDVGTIWRLEETR